MNGSEGMIGNTSIACGIGGVSCAVMGLFLQVEGIVLVSTAAAVGAVGLTVIASVATTLTIICGAALVLGKCGCISFFQIKDGNALAKLCLSAFVPVAVVMASAMALTVFAFSSLPAIAGGVVYIASFALAFVISGLIVKSMVNCCYPAPYEYI